MAMSTPFLVLACLLIGASSSAQVVENRKVYIVYLGEKQHEDPELTEKSHRDMLAQVVGSEEKASKLMVYSYKHGFSGFAAELTDSEAQTIAEQPDVVHVTPNTFHKLQTTRSWDYLGLSSPMPQNLLDKGNMGDGIVIGVIDTGIWPESESFSDEGLGPIPSKWKGSCVSGDEFNATQHCNRKIIGAQYFIDGFIRDMNSTGNVNMTTVRSVNKLSPRDTESHGTHVASVAAGSYVANISYKGLGGGTLRGGATKARIAVYKVCWTFPDGPGGECTAADVAKAIDQAVHDGVDLIQISIGVIPYAEEADAAHNEPLIGTLHAVTKGIPVVLTAGNDGARPQSVSNIEPWVITVGASITDRAFPTPITLGNNKTLMGRSLLTEDQGVKGLVFLQQNSECASLAMLSNQTSLVGGKVILCFMSTDIKREDVDGINWAKQAGAVGAIVAKGTCDILQPSSSEFQTVEVDHNIGIQIVRYIRSANFPTVKFSPSKTLVGGKYVQSKVAYFSSRGPNSVAPAILKPDIIAPGSNILAAVVPGKANNGGFAFMSGTSMAAPHVSGIVALLKQAHPDWSPAALKSALMTTAWNTNRHGLPIHAEEQTTNVAHPFDMGAGIVNPNGAFDPGLVYDMDVNDYVQYYCGMGYGNSTIFKVTKKTCPAESPSILDLNLPSITIPSLRNSMTVKRTVTNVGPMNSAYKAMINPPPGTVISVRPKVLVFNSKTNKRSFKLTVYSVNQVNSAYYNFGSLTWTDGIHVVRSPISVQTEVEMPLDY